MPKASSDILSDIIASIDDVLDFTADLAFDEFTADRRTQYAVLYALAVIGEAIRSLPAELQQQFPMVDWRGYIGLRNVIIHQYSGVRLSDIWDVICNELPQLRAAAVSLLL